MNKLAFLGVDWLDEGDCAVGFKVDTHHGDAFHGGFASELLLFTGDLGIGFHAQVVHFLVRDGMGSDGMGLRKWVSKVYLETSCVRRSGVGNHD